MADTQERKPWSTPTLIVLDRGTPEENVLLGCKNNTAGQGKGPGDTVEACVLRDKPTTACEAWSAS